MLKKSRKNHQDERLSYWATHLPQSPSRLSQATNKELRHSSTTIEKNKLVKSMDISGHTFFYATAKGSGVMQLMFNLADEQQHRVFICLDLAGNRTFASFPDIDNFLDFYLSYKGPRTFYYINRSYFIKSESSILYMDLE